MLYFERESFEPSNASYHTVDQYQPEDFRGVFRRETNENVRANTDAKADRCGHSKLVGNARVPRHADRYSLEMIDDVVDDLRQLIQRRINRTVSTDEEDAVENQRAAATYTFGMDTA